MAATNGRKQDRRSQRTERRLHDALSTLIREKAYDSIAVKEILDRADVGRSTFYTHFRDKDELLITGIQELLRGGAGGAPRAGARSPDVLWFSRPFFAHLEQHRRSDGARTGLGGRLAVHEHLERVVADLVGAELKRVSHSNNASDRIPTDLLARHVAATFAPSSPLERR